MEPLEPRRVLGAVGIPQPNLVLTVNSAADDPAGPTAGVETLRDAIVAVNSDANDNAAAPDVINFAIAGAATITLAGDLPAIASPVTIDGSGQGGATVDGAGYAMLVVDSAATINGMTFTDGTATLEPGSTLTVNAGSSVSVTGDLDAGSSATLYNYGSVLIGGNFVGADSVGVTNGKSGGGGGVVGDSMGDRDAEFYGAQAWAAAFADAYGRDGAGGDSTAADHAQFPSAPAGPAAFTGPCGSGGADVCESMADGEARFSADQDPAATFTVGGAFTAGADSDVYNNGTAAFSVAQGFSLGDSSDFSNGYYSTDAASLSVGGSFSMGQCSEVFNSGASVLSVAGDFTQGDSSDFYNGSPGSDATTCTVGGSFSTGLYSDVYNTSALRITGDFAEGNSSDFFNGNSGTDTASLSVGGSFTIGDSSAGPNDGGCVYNNDVSIFLVQGDLTLYGDGGSSVYNGRTLAAAATLTVGGNLSFLDASGPAANGFVGTVGTNPLTVAGNFTMGADSYFEDYGLMSAGGAVDPGSGCPGYNNLIGGTFTAAPGSAVTTDTSTWEVLAGGLLHVEDRASLTLAPGGSLLLDAGSALTVDSGGSLVQAGGTVSYGDNYTVTWTWTGQGGDGNWDTAANWSATPSPHWVGGSTNAYPGQGAVAGENDFVSIDTGVVPATITVQSSDTLSVERLDVAAADTLAIAGGTLTVSANSELQGPLVMSGGTLAAQGYNVTLTATDPASVSGASLSASGGATLSLPLLGSYDNPTANNPTAFSASGTGSLLDLPALASLGTLDSQLTISAQNGGDVNLSALAIPSGTPNVTMQTAGAGSQINTAGLVTIGPGQSETVSAGMFSTTSYDLFPQASLTVCGGTFGADFDLDAGASVTIEGGTFDGATFYLAAGATVNVCGGTFTGTTTWNVSQGATVTVNYCPTVGGTWTGSGQGTIELNLSRLYIGSGGLAFDFPAGMLEWTGGVMDAGLGDLTNLGTMELAGPSDKMFYNDGIFDNFGTIIQTGSGNLYLGTDNLFPCALQNEVGATYEIRGDGGIGEVQDMIGSAYFPSLDNAGTFVKSSGGGASTIDLCGTITNTGTVEADSGTLFFDTGTFAQVSAGALTGGTWNALNGATLELPGSTAITSSAADITLDGAGASITGLAGLDANSGSFTLTDGAAFTATGDFANSGTLTVGAGSTLNVAGNFTQTAGAELNEQIGGPPGGGQFGQISVAGTASLAGELALDLLDGFVPSIGQSFPLLSFSASSGNFAEIQNFAAFNEVLNPTDLELDVLQPTIDLAASTVAAPSTATIGQDFTVTWQVANQGNGDATGDWQDAVYVSSTPTLSPRATLLGIVPHNGGLAVGDSYQGSLTAAFPAVLGQLYGPFHKYCNNGMS
jgi:hypothetical protein